MPPYSFSGRELMKIFLPENVDWVGSWTGRSATFTATTPPAAAPTTPIWCADEKTVLVDAVRAPFAEQLLAGVAALCDPAQVAYVVCNHAEPDHSGALPK